MYISASFHGWTMLLVLAAAAGLVMPLRGADDAEHEFFEKQVRPILVARCYECHSESSKTIQGNLRVDGRALLMTGGDTGPAIIPGNAKESLLIDAINYGDIYQMPPKSRMPAEEVAVLTKWVNSGAIWPNDTSSSAATSKAFDLEARRKEHWAWQPIQQLSPPKIQNGAWPLQPLDNFVLAKIESAGMSPAAPAQKHTLLRRVYFDLIGLPPTPEEVTAFEADDSPQALEKVVEKLLALPQFGERWGRHWLDLTRYAESRGHEFDYDAPNAYQYRDYVIRALNADVPYDQFAIEHLAGDLLPQPRLNPEEGYNESILGTGYWFLGEWVHSPVDLRKDEADRYDNMVDVFSKTFLGLTVSCARCHDHKFDAISQADYYALFGYLKSSSYRLARFETMEQHQHLVAQFQQVDQKYLPQLARLRAQEAAIAVDHLAEKLLAGDPNLQTGPWQEIWQQAVRVQKEKGDSELAKVAAGLSSKRQEQLAKAQSALSSNGLQMIADYTQPESPWQADGPTFGNGPVVSGALIASGAGDSLRPAVSQWGGAQRDERWNGLTLSADTGNDPGALGRTVRAGRTIKTPTFTLEKPDLYYLVKGTGTAYATIASHAVINGPLHGAIYHDLGGKPGETPLRWARHSLPTYVGQKMHVELSAKDDEPLQVLMIVQADSPPPLPIAPEDAQLAGRLAELSEHSLDGWAEAIQKFVADTLPLLQENRLAAADVSADQRAIANFILQSDFFNAPVDSQPAQKYAAKLQEYRAEVDRLTSQIRRDSHLALAIWDGNGVNEHLMIRGNPSVKTLGPEVPRNLLTAINEGLRIENSANSPTGSGRLELAKRMMLPGNPFPARVAVNRIWHHLLGRGIVPSTDNFGVLGTAPSHPELLDFLAQQFIQEGWSQKRLIKSVILSRTYQQASDPAAADVEERDPENLLWRRTNVRRLEGEVIRDAMLALSGRLDKKLFGPSVPVYLNDFLQGRGRPSSGPLDGAGRRSIYISVRRNFLSPMMLAFDTPSPFSTVGRRNVSNVPAQALILMNDPFVVEQAKLWARKLLQAGVQTPEERIARCYEEAFARAPTEHEVKQALEFLRTQGEALGIAPDQAITDDRTWGDLCHVLWNVKEFVFLQ